jgi:hypothetical protein
MTHELTWTLAAIAGLGGTAFADDEGSRPVSAQVLTTDSGSARGVAEDYLVLPQGGEITSQMKFITADPLLGGQPLKFTDLALFGLTARWAVLSRLEVAATVELLPKQPSYTEEKPWQSAGVTLRSPLGSHLALALSGGGGHLLAHTGMWSRESLMIEWKKVLDRELLAFDVQGGIDGTGLRDGGTSALLTEIAVQTSALFREPTGHWGAWVGIAYAVPVQKSGDDPTTAMPIDPQPRVDFHIGTVLAIVHDWDLFADLAWIDRGDLAAPATRLPILDGGFDQKQIVFGVTRHIEARVKKHPGEYVGTRALELK